MPTGGGKSFVALAQLLQHQNEEMLYIAPQNEILEQTKDYIIKYIHGPVNTIGRSKEEIIADVFPNLKFSTYSGLIARGGKKLVEKEYGFVVLDELHRTGAEKWGERLNELIDNQPKETKVLGITATPRRDVDGINMANEMAQRLGYTNQEAIAGKHIAINMSLTNAIRMGLVVNPKLVTCAYNLKTDGSLDELKNRIEEIEDVQTKNEKLEEYEKLRRKIETAEGMAEVLKANVKQGGKYIVFLPMVEGLEDEDGNIIGKKDAKGKIEDYQKQLEKYFEGSNIIPKFNSMLGEYGDKENAKQLEEFQNENSEETQFLLVLNKANEGLHLDKLDGMVWFRPLDENSKILYLQQLGRVINTEDPDNPTKEEERPVVIDLVNNTLKVKWNNEPTEIDNIQMLTLIKAWSEEHNGILPNINSTNKEETGYATTLKDIQTKYIKYLDGNFEGLEEKQIQEIKHILDLGAEIDLWQTQLPDRQIIAKGSNTQSNTKQIITPFEIEGILKDFVEIEEVVEEIENETSVERFINKLNQLEGIGVEVAKLQRNDTIEILSKRSGISRKEIEKIGLNPEEKIGSKLHNIKSAYRGKGKWIKPTEEQVKEIERKGISFEERDTIQEFIEELNQLEGIGVVASKLQQRDTIEKLAQRSGVSRETIEKIGLNPEEKIGNKLSHIRRAHRGLGRGAKPTEEQVKEITEMGINLEKEERDVIQEFIEELKRLKEKGVSVSKIVRGDTIETLVQKSGISKEELEKLGLDPKEKIGLKLKNIKSAHRGTGTGTKPTEEQVEEFKNLGISFEKRNIIQEFIEELDQLEGIGVVASKLQQRDTIERLAQRSGVSRETIEKIGLNPEEKIGHKLSDIRSACRGKGHGTKPTEEQVEELEKMGISIESKKRTTKEIVQASIESLTDIEMADREDAALKELIQKEKTTNKAK